MNRITLGLVVAGGLFTAGAAVLAATLLLVARKAAPGVRARMVEMPQRVREVVPTGLGPRRMMGDLDAMTEELHRIRELLERQEGRSESA